MAVGCCVPELIHPFAGADWASLVTSRLLASWPSPSKHKVLASMERSRLLVRSSWHGIGDRLLILCVLAFAASASLRGGALEVGFGRIAEAVRSGEEKPRADPVFSLVSASALLSSCSEFLRSSCRTGSFPSQF
jgi:hypothetical protein